MKYPYYSVRSNRGTFTLLEMEFKHLWLARFYVKVRAYFKPNHIKYFYIMEYKSVTGKEV